jgi:hypothetical protein
MQSLAADMAGRLVRGVGVTHGGILNQGPWGRGILALRALEEQRAQAGGPLNTPLRALRY